MNQSLERPTVTHLRTYRFLAMVALGFCVSWTGLAQQGPDDDADVKIGYTNNFFHHSSVDSINLYNGQLTIPIPVGPTYPVGPKLKFQAMLAYTSKVWEFGNPSNPDPQGNLYMPVVGDPALGIGWTFTLGAIKSCGTAQSQLCYISPDGAEHQFSAGAKTQDASQFYLQEQRQRLRHVGWGRQSLYLQPARRRL